MHSHEIYCRVPVSFKEFALMMKSITGSKAELTVVKMAAAERKKVERFRS